MADFETFGFRRRPSLSELLFKDLLSAYRRGAKEYYVQVADRGRLPVEGVGLGLRDMDSVLAAVQGVALAVRANLGHSAEIHAGDVAVRYTGDPRTNVCLMVDNLQVVPDKLGLEEGDAASGGQVSLVRQGKSLLLVSNALLKDVQVFDMRGVLVFSLSDLSGTWIEMPMEDWADGLYLFRVRLCNGKEVCLKFVKAGR